MNVGRAYRVCINIFFRLRYNFNNFIVQFFGEKTAIAMEIYRENNYDLIDCEPSVILIRRINSLIQAMDSRIPSNSLRKASPEYKVGIDHNCQNKMLLYFYTCVNKIIDQF